MYDAVGDDYCYAGTTVLKNKLDLRDADELASFEAEMSDARADEEAPAGELDFKHFKAIHHHLFQDVYDWAGKTRNVRMSKGGNPFAFPENIENEATKLFTQLEEDNFLQDLLAKDFAEKSAHFLAELNVIHAFREGNGRIDQRLGDTLAAITLAHEETGHGPHRRIVDRFCEARGCELRQAGAQQQPDSE
jgi:cell filamentation protein